MNVIALVPLTENDHRLSGALINFQGESLLSHAVRGLLHSECVDRVIVAGPPQNTTVYSAALESVADTRVRVVAGGAGRSESVRSALAAHSVRPSDIVLVHDPARPFTPAATIRAVIESVRSGAPSAVPVELVTDTIKLVDSDDVIRGTRDRSTLRSTQSPQAFRAEVLRDTGLDPLGEQVHTVAGHPHAMRIATSFDLAVAEALLNSEK
ncbi:IspD/TarI family cytidylyltransferase [Prauserella cavernicola]|uniref:2-C-methyl-D-erythritol 4-phosphate cytidylyltransferase n=1 Tax=Prauserella cavernicola TaxID=2800127 RepID=A0A934QTS5_9PSEU|nr:2-C-methyl-D-erythritol 4-phosphate cytidylyltransferase [Prauserella cavernicola]MBK1785243.1 2-C-methyl-D-erythritol 4-phosphate cytidylyltransferase [Prauserella cavernicola]